MLLPRLNIGNRKIVLPASKSLSNRWLIMKFLSGGKTDIKNLSTADDTLLLQNLLAQLAEGSGDVFHCENAGTAARFLTALLATQERQSVVTGNERMKSRPIAELVEKLHAMGAEIRYLEKKGFLPVEIRGGILKGGEIRLSGEVSSQFASALLLASPRMENPLTLVFEKEPVSKSYISMTCEVLRQCGADVVEESLRITADAGNFAVPAEVYVESDWTSASYFYNCVALSENAVAEMHGLSEKSIQGDSVLPDIYEKLGVETSFTDEGAVIKKNGHVAEKLCFDCKDNPDIVPALAVACAGLGIEAELKNLRTLVFKECDRLQAVSGELRKLNCRLEVSDSCLHIFPSQLIVKEAIGTFGDHRMAMAFATLACVSDNVNIENHGSVTKSFPCFWTELLKNN